MKYNELKAMLQKLSYEELQKEIYIGDSKLIASENSGRITFMITSADHNPPTVLQRGLINELRTTTGYGIMDCKKALEDSDWDFNKAKIYLTKKDK